MRIPPKNIGAGIFAGFLCLDMAFMSYALVYENIPSNNREALLLLLGNLLGVIGLIAGYYYGSSQSSRSKDETIKSMTKGDSQ